MRKLLLLLLLVYTIPCLAQDAKLKGTVYSLDTDGTRKVLPAASVRLEGTAVQQEVLADAEGRFLFTDIPPGDYTLHVSMQGFDPYTKSYKLLPGSVGNLEIDLKISPVSEVMEVRTQAIDRSNTSTSSSITERVLRSAPMVNEQFQEALPMLPGIVRGPDGMLNIKGARSGQTGLLVNSTNVTDPVTGDYAISLPLEAVQSVTVLSNPYSAEYGKFSGAVTSVSTRSGGDKWRLLFTNFIPRLRRREDSQGKTHIVGLSSLTPRLVVTGPLIQNRLTISQSFEYKFVRTRIPSLPDLRNDTVLETFDSFTQLDYKLNNHNTLQAIVSIFPQNSSFVNLNTFNEMEVTPNFRQRGFFISLSARSIVGHGGLFESNFSVKRFNAFVFPQGNHPMTIGVDRNTGNFFNRQSRYSTRYDGSAVYSLPQLSALGGTHNLKIGVNTSVSTFNGRDTSSPIRIVRADGSLSQLIEFTGGREIAMKGFEQTVFLQDRLTITPRLLLDLGLRYDFNSQADQNNLAPRLGFLIVPFADGKTVIRGGIGLFYDKIPLGTSTFDRLQNRQISYFDRQGRLTGRELLLQRNAGKLIAPYSLSTTIEVDRQVYKSLYFRFGFQKREGFNEFIVEPGQNEMLISNGGRSSYREFQFTVRYRFSDSDELSLSYVRSRSFGDLNDYNSFYGNFRQPVIRSNERGRLAFDAPDRLLLSGTLELPFRLVLSPILEIRTGFPYSLIDEDQRFITRNQERFPRFLSLDLQIVRPVTIPFRGKKIKARVGLKFFNLGNHFNPRDVQSNLDSPNFGTFYNSIPSTIRGKFEFDF